MINEGVKLKMVFVVHKLKKKKREKTGPVEFELTVECTCASSNKIPQLLDRKSVAAILCESNMFSYVHYRHELGFAYVDCVGVGVCVWLHKG